MDLLYGSQTALACENFRLTYHNTDMRLIYAIVKVKKAAALTFVKIKEGEKELYQAITLACDRILRGEADDSFVTNALQGGAGTSAHMNVNEVVAAIAKDIYGGEVRPLEDVNKWQSTNDVYPTALRIAAIESLRELCGQCAKLQEALQKKENEFGGVKKIGRTELMRAEPITLGMEFGSYAQAVARDRWRLYKAEERLRQVNIGGAMVGTYVADKKSREYRFGVIEKLREMTGVGLAVAEYPMDCTQNQDVFVETSGLLKALSVNLMKISTDLRLMNMDEIGEIKLKTLQMGSTIMPGKVNPVIPEMTIQTSIKVQANDFAVTMAAGRGEFELNAFLPLIADMMLESLSLLTDSVRVFREKCVETLSAPRV
ncbi:MAG: aspartate ammonia-lyase [Clostridiales bacterium]|jgi:aspartate ammonia-lyase|nr:aspartate ammonia-lyase [Clostridiales bacterium]